MDLVHVILTGEWLEDKRFLADYDIVTIEDTSYWMPAYFTAHPEPEDGSPAAAFVAAKQILFLRGLSVEPSFTDMLPRADMVCSIYFILCLQKLTYSLSGLH